MYIDGSQSVSATHDATVFDFDTVVNLGKPEEDVRFYTGDMDEVRLSSVARSADWVQASYLSQQANSTFITYPVLVTVPDVTNKARATAQSNIVANSLAVGTVTASMSLSVKAGDVISQSPTGGTLAVEGSSVDLVISNGNGSVDLTDFSVFSKYWLSDCTEANTWCESMDYDLNNGVGIDDLYEFASRWLN